MYSGLDRSPTILFLTLRSTGGHGPLVPPPPPSYASGYTLCSACDAFFIFLLLPLFFFLLVWRNFTVIQNIRYGNCFVFNNVNKRNESEIKKTSKTGSQFGKILIKILRLFQRTNALPKDTTAAVSSFKPRTSRLSHYCALS